MIEEYITQLFYIQYQMGSETYSYVTVTRALHWRNGGNVFKRKKNKIFCTLCNDNYVIDCKFDVPILVNSRNWKFFLRSEFFITHSLLYSTDYVIVPPFTLFRFT